MKNNYWENGNDIGHYGIMDDPEMFYPECRSHLEKDLASGRDFNTGWHGFKKEIQSICIKAEGDQIEISVWVSMDDMPDLIYDCDGGEELTPEQINYVFDLWCETLYTTECTEYGRLPRSADIQDIVDLADYLADNCNKELSEGFEWLQSAVADALKYAD